MSLIAVKQSTCITQLVDPNEAEKHSLCDANITVRNVLQSSGTQVDAVRAVIAFHLWRSVQACPLLVLSL